MAFACNTICVFGETCQVGNPPLWVFLQVLVLVKLECFLHPQHALCLRHSFARVPPGIWAPRLQLLVRRPGFCSFTLSFLLQDEAYLVDGEVAPCPVHRRFHHAVGMCYFIAQAQLDGLVGVVLDEHGDPAVSHVVDRLHDFDALLAPRVAPQGLLVHQHRHAGVHPLCCSAFYPHSVVWLNFRPLLRLQDHYLWSFVFARICCSPCVMVH